MSECILDQVSGWVARLAEIEGRVGSDAVELPEPMELTDAGRIELLGALEGLKAAAAAGQARITAAFAASQREALTAAGVPVGQQARSIGAQVALARRVSPRHGSQHLGLAQALVAELPATMAALTAGEASEWRATLVARETACLARADRLAVDAELSARPGGIGGMGDRQIAAEARRVAYRLDPSSVVRRSERAASQRCVTLRPAPDAMTFLTALLPVASGVAAHAALGRAADTARAHGDSRTRGQLMADLLTSRLTGGGLVAGTESGAYDPARWDTPPAAAVPVPGGPSGTGAPPGSRVEVQLVMTDTALLGQDDTPGEVVGYGPVPAALARRLVRDTAEEVWVRRLYAAPSTGRLVAMESRAREFPPLLRRFLVTRDEVCRTPWCGAPIRHADHVVAHADGGPTTELNGQGLCEGCNQVKEAPGWTARSEPDGGVLTITPTGHTWASPPRARWGRTLSRGRPAERVGYDIDASPGEHRVRRMLAVA